MLSNVNHHRRRRRRSRRHLHHHHHHHHHHHRRRRHGHRHRHVGNEKLLEVACIVTEFPNAKILVVLSVHASIPKDISLNIAVVRVVLEFSNERSLAIVWVITTNGFALFSKVVGSCVSATDRSQRKDTVLLLSECCLW